MSVYSIRRAPKFHHEGYLYRKEKTTESGTTYWECDRRRDQRCKARLHTIDGAVVKEVGTHTCKSPSSAQVEAAAAVCGIKTQCMESMEITRTVIAKNVACLSQAASTVIPSVKSLKRTVQRERNRHLAPLPLPLNLNDLIIPPEKSLTLRGLEILSAWSMCCHFLLFIASQRHDSRVCA